MSTEREELAHILFTLDYETGMEWVPEMQEIYGEKADLLLASGWLASVRRAAGEAALRDAADEIYPLPWGRMGGPDTFYSGVLNAWLAIRRRADALGGAS